MRKRTLVVVVVLAAVAAVIGVANAGGAGAEGPAFEPWGRRAGSRPAATSRSAEPSEADLESTAGQVLKYVQQSTGDEAFVDNGPQGESVGDFFIFRERLLDPGTRAYVGSLSVQCTLTFGATEASECLGTAILFGRGKITLAGNAPNYPRFAVAITGGTLEFRGARGQAFVNDNTRQIAFHLV